MKVTILQPNNTKLYEYIKKVFGQKMHENLYRKRSKIKVMREWADQKVKICLLKKSLGLEIISSTFTLSVSSHDTKFSIVMIKFL